jgi:hypothetical protein
MNPKPWYWPVTTTVYKLIVGYLLGIGSAAMIDFIFPSLPTALLILFSFLLAVTIYISLVKKDWL